VTAAEYLVLALAYGLRPVDVDALHLVTARVLLGLAAS
jgi:hypothetical protein